MTESKLPSPLVVMFWLNDESQMRPIACATEDKREDASRRAEQCFNCSVHDYVHASELEAALARIRELESLRLVRSEPAIPRCRTCGNYTKKPDGYRCELASGLWVPGASENGFCHNHTDLK